MKTSAEVVLETNTPPEAVGTVDEASPRFHSYWVPYQDNYTVTLYVYDDAGGVGTDTPTVAILRVIGGEEMPLDIETVMSSMLYSYWWVPTLVATVLAVVYIKRRR